MPRRKYLTEIDQLAPHRDNDWYICKMAVDDPYGDTARYLSADGQWHMHMAFDATRAGGTYFETQAEAEAVAAKFKLRITAKLS